MIAKINFARINSAKINTFKVFSSFSYIIISYYFVDKTFRQYFSCLRIVQRQVTKSRYFMYPTVLSLIVGGVIFRFFDFYYQFHFIKTSRKMSHTWRKNSRNMKGGAIVFVQWLADLRWHLKNNNQIYNSFRNRITAQTMVASSFTMSFVGGLLIAQRESI